MVLPKSVYIFLPTLLQQPNERTEPTERNLNILAVSVDITRTPRSVLREVQWPAR